MGKKSKNVKKLRSKTSSERAEVVGAPHSFVFHRGKPGKHVQEVVSDFRKVMSPYTAENLKARKQNTLKDFISVAGPLHVSHMIMFSRTDSSVNLRVCKLPRGPTLSFKVNSYALSRDVVSSLKRFRADVSRQYQTHPLLVLNNLGGAEEHVKVMASMFQNMFPSINVNKVNLNEIQRCVLFNYDKEKNTIDFRHYNIRVVPVGLSRAVKKLIQSKIPDLGSLEDISQFVNNTGITSESEGEQDGPHNEVTLPQEMRGGGNLKSSQSAVRLTEIGPRLTLSLAKVEEGVCTGQVLYHRFSDKTPKEVEAIKRELKQRKLLKARRKREQEANIKRKEEAKEDARVELSQKKGGKDTEADELPESAKQDEDEPMDDKAYYRQEVGVEPDSGMFSSYADRSRKRTLTQRSGSQSGTGKKTEDGEEGRQHYRPATTKKFKKGESGADASDTGKENGRGSKSGYQGQGLRGQSASRGQSESRGRGMGSRGRGMGSRGRGTGSRDRDTGSRGRGTGSRGRGMGSRGRDTGSRDRSMGSRGRGTGSRGRGMGSRGQQDRGGTRQHSSRLSFNKGDSSQRGRGGSRGRGQSRSHQSGGRGGKRRGR